MCGTWVLIVVHHTLTIVHIAFEILSILPEWFEFVSAFYGWAFQNGKKKK